MIKEELNKAKSLIEKTWYLQGVSGIYALYKVVLGINYLHHQRVAWVSYAPIVLKLIHAIFMILLFVWYLQKNKNVFLLFPTYLIGAFFTNQFSTLILFDYFIVRCHFLKFIYFLSGFGVDLFRYYDMKKNNETLLQGERHFIKNGTYIALAICFLSYLVLFSGTLFRFYGR